MTKCGPATWPASASRFRPDRHSANGQVMAVRLDAFKEEGEIMVVDAGMDKLVAVAVLLPVLMMVCLGG